MSKEKISLNISGMSCVNCSNGIIKVIDKLDGIKQSKVNFASNSGEFLIDSSKITKKEIIQKIKNLGYGVQEDIKSLQRAKAKEYSRLKRSFYISSFFTTAIFIVMFYKQHISNSDYILWFLASIVQFYVGKRFYILAYKAIKHKNYDMNVLVALGTSAAYFYSTFVILLKDIFPSDMRFLYFDGSAVIITFMLLGRLLEERSKAKATNMLKELINLAPTKANLIVDKKIKQIEANRLNIGDLILVKQGETIPADGVIIKGDVEIDTSMITGESLFSIKHFGDEVIAGTTTKNGIITVKVTKKSNESKLSQIITLLQEAGNKKLEISRFADRVANIFVPSVIIISIFTFIIWTLFVGDIKSAIFASISVLIISCPCALGLATPIAIVSSVGKSAKSGILIKNPEILENIQDIKYAVFDKTGTITKGNLSVKNMAIKKEYLNLVASSEVKSEHPISKAIVKWAEDNGIDTNETIDDMKIIVGKGIKATSDKKEILVGNLRLFEDNNVTIDVNILKEFNQILENGDTAVLASVDKKFIGIITLEDPIKDEAKNLIDKIKDKNITPILLTGDNQITAKKVANKIKIDTVYAEVLPDEKYKVIKELQNSGKVMFVGDGLNDSLPVKQADIGIVFASGSDITKNVGDIILMNNSLKTILTTINISKKTISIVKQNLFWAFIYNLIGIPVAAGVLYPSFGIMLSPMYAGVAMSFSSVTVVLNSLRLLLHR